MTLHLEIVNSRPEAQYFFLQDQKMLREYHRALDEEKKLEDAVRKRDLHWMKCPKCGNDLVEIEANGVYLDRCTSCKGIFLDSSEEWELPLDLDRKESFISTLHSLLVGDEQQLP